MSHPMLSPVYCVPGTLILMTTQHVTRLTPPLGKTQGFKDPDPSEAETFTAENDHPNSVLSLINGLQHTEK